MSEQSQIAPAEPDEQGVAPATLADPAAQSSPTTPGTGAQSRGLLRALRPKQWIKNLLVAAAPGAAGVLAHGDVIGKVALAFVAFCMVSSATYLINDVGDADEDRHHPIKRQRPIAAGVLSPLPAFVTTLARITSGLADPATGRWGCLRLACRLPGGSNAHT